MALAKLNDEQSINNAEPRMGNPRGRESPADRVRIVCDLFNLAFEMKSLELERRFPQGTPEWIKSETLRLIEVGTK
jgi:hypothetical protein